MERTQSSFAAFERRDVKLTEDMKHCKAQLKKVQAAISKDAKKEEDCTREADQITNLLENARRSLADIQARKAEEEASLDEIMQGLQQATTSLREGLEVAQANLAEAERGIATLQTEKESVTTSIQLLQSRSENAMKGVQTAEEKLAKVESDKAATQQKIAASVQEKADIETRLVALQREIDAKENEEVRLQGQLRAAVTNAEEAKAAMSSQGAGKNTVYASIMKAARKGGPLASAGVIGRLGDLATISSEYDVAIR